MSPNPSQGEVPEAIKEALRDLHREGKVSFHGLFDAGLPDALPAIRSQRDKEWEERIEAEGRKCDGSGEVRFKLEGEWELGTCPGCPNCKDKQRKRAEAVEERLKEVERQRDEVAKAHRIALEELAKAEAALSQRDEQLAIAHRALGSRVLDLPAPSSTSPQQEVGVDVSGSEKATQIFSLGEWEGQRVSVLSDGHCTGHRLEPVDHYGLPTAFLMCSECQGIATKPAALTQPPADPEVAACTRCGRPNCEQEREARLDLLEVEEIGEALEADPEVPGITGHEIEPLRDELVADPEVPRCGEREPCDGEGHVHEDGAVLPCPGCSACRKGRDTGFYIVKALREIPDPWVWPETISRWNKLPVHEIEAELPKLQKAGWVERVTIDSQLWGLTAAAKRDESADCQSTPELLEESKSSDEEKAVEVLCRFMCCKAGEQFVDEKLLRPFGFTLEPGPVIRRNACLYDALEQVKLLLAEGETGAAEDTAQRALTQPVSESPGDSGEERLTLKVVVSGAPFEVTINRRQPISTLVTAGLLGAGIKVPDDLDTTWQVRTEQGVLLENLSAVRDGATLFLDPDAAGGASTQPVPGNSGGVEEGSDDA